MVVVCFMIEKHTSNMQKAFKETDVLTKCYLCAYFHENFSDNLDTILHTTMTCCNVQIHTKKDLYFADFCKDYV